MRMANTWVCIFIFFLGLALFTIGLPSQEVIGFDSRFYLFALEMWRHGPTWFPTTYHLPYPDYPATSTFLIYLLAKISGTLNKLIAVLPSALAASLTLVVTYLIAATRNVRWGFFSVCFLLLTFAFVKSARAIALDMYITLITAICFYCLCISRTKWIYLLLFLGFIFRGPIGLIIPTGVVCVYYLIDKNIKKIVVTGIFALLILIVSSILLFALANEAGGHEFMQKVLRMEILGRIGDGHLPFYFYFLDSFASYALSYPVAILVMSGIFYHTKQFLPAKKMLLQLFAWVIIILIGMSIPGDKKIRYILPIAPALALIAAYLFVATNYFMWLRGFMTRFFLYLPAILVIGVEIIYFYFKDSTYIQTFPFWLIACTLIFIQLVNFWLVYRYINQPKNIETNLIFTAVISAFIFYLNLIEPIELHVEKAREFVITMEVERAKEQAQLVFYKEREDALPIKYLINMPQEDTPLFVTDALELEKIANPFILMTVNHFNHLPKVIMTKFQIVASDKMAHTPVVVLRKISHE